MFLITIEKKLAGFLHSIKTHKPFSFNLENMRLLIRLLLILNRPNYLWFKQLLITTLIPHVPTHKEHECVKQRKV